MCVCVCVCMCVYDSHVFEPLKDAISGANFSNDEEVLLWLRTEPKNILLSSGVTKSLEHWTKCTEKGESMYKNDKPFAVFVYEF